MVKEQILNLEKNQLIGLINEMTLENTGKILDNIQAHINLLLCLNKIEYEPSEGLTESETFPLPEAKIEESQKPELQIETPPVPELLIEPPLKSKVKASEHSFQEGWTNNRKSYIGIFSRRLRGGFVGDIYVPESMVRSLGLEYLDWVKATVRKVVNNRTMCDFTVIKKHEEYDEKSMDTINKRETIEHGIVKYEETADKYFLSVNTSDSLLKVVLSEADINKFNIESGDIVDYAYWKYDNIMDGKVVWKHSVEDIKTLEQARPTLTPTFKKSKSDEVGVDISCYRFLQLFNSLTPILV